MVEVRRVAAAVGPAPAPEEVTSPRPEEVEPAGARGIPHGLSEQDLLQLYYYLKLGRALEERLYTLYRQGRIPGAVYLGRGQEATTIGASYATEAGDVVGGTHRDLLIQIPRGMTPRRIIANHVGKATGPTRGRDGSSHSSDLSLGVLNVVSHLPDVYPLVAGSALAFKMRGEPRVALGFCGDGATSNGQWHESLNFAAVLMLPAVFIVENNQFSYSTPNCSTTHTANFADRAAAYGIPGIVVDGNDVLEVYAVARSALDRARAGGGPTLIEAATFRVYGHAGHDNAEYVPDGVRAYWEARDPIGRYEWFLRAEGLLSDDRRAETESRIMRELRDAVRFAMESPDPKPEEVTDGVYH